MVMFRHHNHLVLGLLSEINVQLFDTDDLLRIIQTTCVNTGHKEAIQHKWPLGKTVFGS